MARSWTLNARHGYYVATGLRDAPIDVDLFFLHESGKKDAVGRFRLDLDALVAKDVVTRRSTAKGSVYDVRIERDFAGVYWLAVRSSPRFALDRCRVRSADGT